MRTPRERGFGQVRVGALEQHLRGTWGRGNEWDARSHSSDAVLLSLDVHIHLYNRMNGKYECCRGGEGAYSRWGSTGL